MDNQISSRYDSDAQPFKHTPNWQLFVAILSTQTTEKDLQSYFSGFGEVETLRMVVPKNRKDKRFAFINFVEPLSLDNILKLGNHHTVDNQKIYISRAIMSGASSDNEVSDRMQRSLMLKNFPLRVQKTEIESAISGFGPVEQISKLRRSNPSSMFCYVTMKYVSDAISLRQRGYLVFRGKRKIPVETFVPRSERLAYQTAPVSHDEIQESYLVRHGNPSEIDSAHLKVGQSANSPYNSSQNHYQERFHSYKPHSNHRKVEVIKLRSSLEIEKAPYISGSHFLESGKTETLEFSSSRQGRQLSKMPALMDNLRFNVSQYTAWRESIYTSNRSGPHW